jgi:hypothetical protein
MQRVERLGQVARCRQKAPRGLTNVAIDVNYRIRGYLLLHELMHSQYGGKWNPRSDCLEFGPLGADTKQLQMSRSLTMIMTNTQHAVWVMVITAY